MFRPVLTILALLLVLLAGCGKKGPVQPLKQPLPAAPREIDLRQVGMRFLLAWEIPDVNQNGTPLTDLKGFHIYRMSYNPAEDCPECRDTSVMIGQVDLDYLRDVTRLGDRLYFWDAGPKPGPGYKYRVVPFNKKNREGAQAQVRSPMVEPPLPPAALEATPHDRLVRLSWQPVEEAYQGAQWLGYNLYRRQPGEPFPPLPLNHEPLVKSTYEDFDVRNDATYFYAVRSVLKILDHPVESPLSDLAEAVPRQGL